MPARTPDGPPPPPAVQRMRIRYAKRGRLRFSSHRDFQRAFERALRRAGVPMAYSAGFSPHPKISYVGAAPTGTASEAEYLEIALTEPVEPAGLRAALDDALPAGLDVMEAVEAGSGSLAERVNASDWRIELAGVPVERAAAAVAAFLDQAEVPVVRVLKDGARTLDARAPVVLAEVTGGRETRPGKPAGEPLCAILRLVVRHVTPAVRPDDILAGLRLVADLVPPVPPSVTRLAQGLLDVSDDLPARIADPLAPDRGAGRLADVAGAPLPR